MIPTTAELRSALNAANVADQRLRAFLLKLLLFVIAIVFGSSVATPADLTLLNDSDMPDGNHIYTISNDQFYVLDKTNSSVVDGNIIVPTLSGIGNWVQYPYRSLLRTSWFVTGTSGVGDDTASGGSTTPLLTLTEMQRRIGIHRGNPIGITGVGITINLLGETTENVLWDMAPYKSRVNAGAGQSIILKGTIAAPGTTDVISAVTVPAAGTYFLQEISTPIVLVAGDIIQRQSDLALAKVIGAGTVSNYAITPFQSITAPTTPVISTGLAVVNNVIGKVTLPKINGELRIRTTENLFIQNIEEENTAVGGMGVHFMQGRTQLINCNIKGGTNTAGGTAPGLNQIDQGATVISNCYWQLSNSLENAGTFIDQITMWSGNVAGTLVLPGGNHSITGGTQAVAGSSAVVQGGSRHIHAGAPTAQRSYLAVAGSARIGSSTGATGFAVVTPATGAATGPLSGFVVLQGGYIEQTATSTCGSPFGIATGDGIRVAAGGKYIAPNAAAVPRITGATSDTLIGGRSCLYASLPATHGVNLPSVKVATVGAVGPVTAVAGTAKGCTVADLGTAFQVNFTEPIDATSLASFQVADSAVTGDNTTTNCQTTGGSQVTVRTYDGATAGAHAAAGNFTLIQGGSGPNGAAFIYAALSIDE